VIMAERVAASSVLRLSLTTLILSDSSLLIEPFRSVWSLMTSSFRV
jgi:hypothetical protein